MRTIISSMVALLMLVVPVTGHAQDARATLERAAAAMGASGLTTLEYTAAGTMFDVGQSAVPGQRGPQFAIKSYTRSINYETTSVRTDLERARTETRGGGAPAPRQIWMVSGEHAWNVVGETAAPAPVALAQRQFELWTTPHGIIKAAMKYNATVEGRTISFAVPDRMRAKATLTEANLVDKIEAVIPNPVVGDLPVEIRYTDYKDFGGVKFPTKISQSAAGSPWFELTVNEVRPNAAVDIKVPEPVRMTVKPYAQVTSQKAADGVWYLTGGSHHSVAIEMKDHVIVVEAPLNDERAIGVITAVRELVPAKPIHYVIASHHHFDHSGGLRAFASVGVTVVTHESDRAFLTQSLAAPATISPDLLAKSGRKARVEAVRDRRVMSDGTRTVEIHHVAGNNHEDGMLMVYLPKEKLLIQADMFSPAPPNAPPPTTVNPNTVNLADNIARLGLAVDQHLPLHGRMVPMAELNKAIGRAQ
ncbi:MAG: MBL fold metallo-hydrolase [Candidatus Rokuibacteriota bacterium]|nr:MAG: MBL fold metallo-hydrolase [Candidatus Rokubacteria bacterium]